MWKGINHNELKTNSLATPHHSISSVSGRGKRRLTKKACRKANQIIIEYLAERGVNTRIRQQQIFDLIQSIKQ